MAISARATIHLSAVRQSLGISREAMARLLDVSAKSIERWEERDALPASVLLRQRLAEVQEIATLAHMVFEADAIRGFFATPLPALAGHTPLQAIANGDGSRVLSMLAAAYEGAAV